MAACRLMFPLRLRSPGGKPPYLISEKPPYPFAGKPPYLISKKPPYLISHTYDLTLGLAGSPLAILWAPRFALQLHFGSRRGLQKNRVRPKPLRLVSNVCSESSSPRGVPKYAKVNKNIVFSSQKGVFLYFFRKVYVCRFWLGKKIVFR